MKQTLIYTTISNRFFLAKEPNAISYKTNFAENYRNVQVDIPGSSSNASLFTDDSATDIEERLSNDEGNVIKTLRCGNSELTLT